MKEYCVAVVGATGAVGSEMLNALEKVLFPISKVVPLATARSEGKTVQFKDMFLPVDVAGKGSFEGVDIALFSAGEAASRELAPIALAEGALVIDNSNAFRMDDGVPLIIPEVNHKAAEHHKGIIANPNCSTIQMLVALYPLHRDFRIKRIVVSTYQAVSGAGLPAIIELGAQAKAFSEKREMEAHVYPYQIAFNCLPQIGAFMENGYSEEEMKMHHETRKILGDDRIQVTATAVRVPVFNCHSESISIETEKPLPSLDILRTLLANSHGLDVWDDPENKLYPMPFNLNGTDKVYVGRIRKDYTVENGLSLWVVADNLRKGAALNAVQIAEMLVGNEWLKGA
jgi:aspartate-semialdehyde dehydrogenase